MHDKTEERYIVVLGSLLSGIGKGLVSASITKMLSFYGLNVAPMKFDGYLNYDCGTMNPLKHGEVFVLDDKSEVDMDFGTYERFLNKSLSGSLSLTGGKLFSEIITKERRGDYLGSDVQIIPHMTNLIVERVRKTYKDNNLDVLLIEVGGTVGDIENSYFIEAMRELALTAKVVFIDITYIPELGVVGEQKTKPTQLALRSLMQVGIQPDFIITRSDKKLGDKARNKIALFANLKEDNIIDNKDVDNIYEVPEHLIKNGFSGKLMHALDLDSEIDNSKFQKWKDATSKSPGSRLNIAVVGKYVDLKDSYTSIREALSHAGTASRADVFIDWIEAEELEALEDFRSRLNSADGVLVPGGFGNRGIEGMINAITYARESKTPYLGICLGMQLMAIEFARNVALLSGANSSEFDSNAKHKIIDIMDSQRFISEKGGTMRLGSWDAILKPSTLAFEAYGTSNIAERHRHRYEFNNAYKDTLQAHGLTISGTSADGMLVEFIEWRDGYGIGTQAHPELKSRPEAPSPLFVSFIEAAIKRSKSDPNDSLSVRQNAQHKQQ